MSPQPVPGSAPRYFCPVWCHRCPQPYKEPAATPGGSLVPEVSRSGWPWGRGLSPPARFTAPGWPWGHFVVFVPVVFGTGPGLAPAEGTATEIALGTLVTLVPPSSCWPGGQIWGHCPPSNPPLSPSRELSPPLSNGRDTGGTPPQTGGTPHLGRGQTPTVRGVPVPAAPPGVP